MNGESVKKGNEVRLDEEINIHYGESVTGFCWILQGFEEEGVAVEGNGWRHRNEGQKLGGGAHQGQSGWNKTTGATDL
ncbi:hypothetical protein BY996DRAFT_6536242 [Phakopsora pachyrhizi]|nr:hypothetical protein BY996DRAFT_6536242 [Phakopsora pachyrhizi]